MDVILAIDGGGSSTRSLALNREGRIVGQALSGPSNHLLVDRDVVVNSIEGIINKTLSPTLKRSDVVCLSGGFAGVDYDGTGKQQMEEILNTMGFEDLVVNGDMVIAHAGAFGGRPGVLALSGTGSCILGINDLGERIKIGGWGPIYGDEGSAYRIGQTALRAAARAVDGRGPATTLVARIERALELKDFNESVRRVYVEEMESREIAALSHVVNDAAEHGDEVAVSILRNAGEELAEGVIAALNQLHLPHKQASVSYQGSVLASCGILRERFKEVLSERVPESSVKAPQLEPIMGAAFLGFVAAGWEPVTVLRHHS